MINSIGLSYITCSEMLNLVLRRNAFVDVEDVVHKDTFGHRYSRSARAPPQPSVIFSRDRQHIVMPFHVLLDEYMRRVFWNNFTVFEQVKIWTLRWPHSLSTSANECFSLPLLLEKVIDPLLFLRYFVGNQRSERLTTNSYPLNFFLLWTRLTSLHRFHFPFSCWLAGWHLDNLQLALLNIF